MSCFEEKDKMDALDFSFYSDLMQEGIIDYEKVVMRYIEGLEEFSSEENDKNYLDSNFLSSIVNGFSFLHRINAWEIVRFLCYYLCKG